MAEESRVNVISVELAIKRELAYREKVASLLHSNVDFVKELLPLEVPSSSSYQSQDLSPRSLSEPNSIPSKAVSPIPMSVREPGQVPTPGPSLGPTPISRSNQVPNPSYQVSSSNSSLVSTPCPWERPGLPPIPCHSGIKRKEMTCSLQYRPLRQQQKSFSSYIIVDQHGSYFCMVCQVPCSGPINLKQHLKGHKHKSKLQWLQISGKDGQKRECRRQTRCDNCDTWCQDENALEMHAKGQQHGAKVQAFEVSPKNGGEKAIQLPFCELCQIWCTDENSLKMHLNGQKHKAKLQNLEQGGAKASQRPRCDICQIWCMNEDAFMQHLKGQKHATLVSEVQKTEGEWRRRWSGNITGNH